MKFLAVFAAVLATASAAPYGDYNNYNDKNFEGSMDSHGNWAGRWSDGTEGSYGNGHFSGRKGEHYGMNEGSKHHEYNNYENKHGLHEGWNGHENKWNGHENKQHHDNKHEDNKYYDNSHENNQYYDNNKKSDYDYQPTKHHSLKADASSHEKNNDYYYEKPHGFEGSYDHATGRWAGRWADGPEGAYDHGKFSGRQNHHNGLVDKNNDYDNYGKHSGEYYNDYNQYHEY